MIIWALTIIKVFTVFISINNNKSDHLKIKDNKVYEYSQQYSSNVSNNNKLILIIIIIVTIMIIIIGIIIITITKIIIIITIITSIM